MLLDLFDGVVVTLGEGDDLLTIVDTHDGATELNTGAGEDRAAVRKIAAYTTVNGGPGADITNVSLHAGEGVEPRRARVRGDPTAHAGMHAQAAGPLSLAAGAHT